MNLFSLPLIACCALPLLLGSPLLNAQDAPAQKIAIIKADDLRGRSIKWEGFLQVASEEGIKVSIGIICDSLDNPAPEHREWLQGLVASGQVEFWNHGWDHKRWTVDGKEVSEFGGSGLEHQREHMKKAQAASEAVFGKPFNAIGTPFNAMDADTKKVLGEMPALEMVFCYGTPGGLSGKTLLPMNLRGEHDGTGKPNLAKFQEEYSNKGANLTFAALQFHPASFGPSGLDEFRGIVQLLKKEGWVFMLPSEYQAHSRKSASPAPAP